MLVMDVKEITSEIKQIKYKKKKTMTMVIQIGKVHLCASLFHFVLFNLKILETVFENLVFKKY